MPKSLTSQGRQVVFRKLQAWHESKFHKTRGGNGSLQGLTPDAAQLLLWLEGTIEDDWNCVDASPDSGEFTSGLAQMCSRGTVTLVLNGSTSELGTGDANFGGATNVLIRDDRLPGKGSPKVGVVRKPFRRILSVLGFGSASIDDLFMDEPDFKIDLLMIGPCDDAVDTLEGAVATLSRHRPLVVLSLAPMFRSASGLRATIQTMLDLKYSKATLVGDSFVVFESTWALGQPWPTSIQLISDRRFLNMGEMQRNAVSESAERMTGETLATYLGLARKTSWMELPLASIEVLNVLEVSSLLGWSPAASQVLGVVEPRDLLMEREDAQVLAWLYHNARPQHHFEFGTWEGFGTCLCLLNSNATVWTINLQHGEAADFGVAYPGSREPYHSKAPKLRESSDRDEFVGWMYRALGLGPRVHQLLGDSKDMSIQDLPVKTFDTVLIDGGHDLETVLSDTSLALTLVSPTGLLIWHDFSTDPLVWRDQNSTRGVTAAICEMASTLSDSYRLVHIRNTLILLGIPRTLAR